MKIGVIGYGYWGPNLVRNFVETARLPRRGGQRSAASIACAGTGPLSCSRDHDRIRADLLSRRDIDAVAIATPVSTHFELACQALAAGKHVLSRSR